MRIFFDTEFTQFRDGELLSVGLVAEDEHSLVVEIVDRALHARASDFCQQHVLPQFGLLPAVAVRSPAEAGAALARWLQARGPVLQMGFDYKLDWRFLADCLQQAGHADLLQSRLQPFNVADVANAAACLQAQEAYFQTRSRPGRHHALVDALALRARWQAYQQLVTIGGAA